MENEAPRLAYRISELAYATGLSNWYIRREIQTGKLKARKFGSAIVILHDDAMEWLHSLPLVFADHPPPEFFIAKKKRSRGRGPYG